MSPSSPLIALILCALTLDGAIFPQPRRLSDICLEMVLEDFYGDGWDGAIFEVSDFSGAAVATGTLESGLFTKTETLCLAGPGCYTMGVTAGTYPGEITWSLAGGVLNGIAPDDQDFYVNATGAVVPGSCTATPTLTPAPTIFSPRTVLATASCFDQGCSATTIFDTAGFAENIAWAALTIELGGDLSRSTEYAEISINDAEVGTCGEDFVAAFVGDCIRSMCPGFDGRDVTSAARTGMLAISFAGTIEVGPFCGTDSHALEAHVTLVVELSETTYPTPIPTTSLAPTTLIESSSRTLFATTSCFETGCAAVTTFDTTGFAEHIAWAALTIELGGDLSRSTEYAEISINGAEVGSCGEKNCITSICPSFDGRDATAAACTGTLVISLAGTVQVEPDCGTDGHALEADVTLVVELSETAYPTALPTTSPAPTTIIESSPRTLFATARCFETDCAVNVTFDTEGFAENIASAALTVELDGNFDMPGEYAEIEVNGADFGTCGEDFDDYFAATCPSLNGTDVTAAARTGLLVISFATTAAVEPFCGTDAHALEADVMLVVELSETTYPTPIPSTSLAPTTVSPSPAPTSSCLEMVLEDSYGDGWNGATFEVSDFSGAVVVNGTLESGARKTETLCLAGPACYTMGVTAGQYPLEISWNLAGALTGGAPDDHDFYVNATGSVINGSCTSAPTLMPAPTTF